MRHSFKYTHGRLILPIVGLLFLSACDHKDLELSADISGKRACTIVVYDWRYAPDAKPASMELCLYPNDNSDHLSFNLPGRDGSEISLAPGGYDAISMNNDDLDWALYRYTDDKDNFEVYTHDAAEFGTFQLLAKHLGKTRADNSERLASTPEMSWSSRVNNIIVNSDGDNIITFYPKEIVCHYSVEVRNVENISSAQGEVIHGTLSGMAEGYRHGSGKSTETPVTMPFVFVPHADNNTLTSEFLTFGECNENSFDHSLGVYLFLPDGSVAEYSFDVNSQVKNAPDPTHVHIVIDGLSLPKTDNPGGLIPDVKEWNDEIIDIKM